jgi:DNA-cytosine methyltransferase
MRYLSVCSGVEAASVAWHPLGWEAVGYSEIEKFPSEVLAHHYPNTPNFGDMTKYKEWNTNGTVELLVGGTPCQSFSVAGLRKGLEDPRGNLALVYCGILDKFRPKWFVWENVPGVLSSNDGRDFGSFLGAVAELGYGFAYRVLDAQYFGVPQRRRRVFVVGCLGDWLSPAKVLFERESLLRNPPPSRQAREEASAFSPSSFGNYGEGVGTLRRDGGDLGGGSETLVTTNRLVAFGEYADDGTASTLKARDYKDHTDLIVYETHPADSRVKEMGEVCQTVTSRWGTGGGNVPLVQSIGFTQSDAARDVGHDVSPTLRSGGDGGYPNHAVAYGFEPGVTKREGNPNRFTEELSPTLRAQMGDNQASVAYSIREDAKANNFSATTLEVTPALQALRPSVQSHHAQTFVAHAFKVRGGCEGGGKGYLGSDEKAFTLSVTQDQQIAFNSEPNMAVRRLTPVECSRLQGFPDDYLELKYANAEEAHAAQILHELWQQVRKKDFKREEWRNGISSSLLTPQILLTGVHGGWVSWEVARECFGTPGAVACEASVCERLLQAVRVCEELGCSPYQRESFRQFSEELNVPLPELPYENSQARKILRSSRLWQEAQRTWPLRYALATEKERQAGRITTPDAPRYKAMGNSMAVPVMAWIGKRIQEVEDGSV